MLRREFLKLSGVFLAAASMPGLLTACRSNQNDSSISSLWFPQGIASGDPRPTSVVIWTRALSTLGDQSHTITAEVSLDEAFTSLVMQEDFEVSEKSDFTLKVIVENLQPDTFYYYRFMNPSGIASNVGRSLTVPQHSDTRNIHFAFVSCQNRRHGFYSAYRQMINDDQNKPVNEQIRFVLHLGDFIYETNNDPLMTPQDMSLNQIEGGLIDRLGRRRDIGPFPDGGTTSNDLHYAKTLKDYRHLYREYMSDPDLQEALARWPFIHIWDDHEFSDDCWQSEANYNDTGSNSSTDEPSQARKVAANQAWFEYLPLNLLQLDDVDTDLRHAKEFVFSEVQASSNLQVNASNLADNDDNLRAIDTLTVYRNFRFGTLLELAVTDNRSYRSDHAISEAISGNSSVFVHPRIAMPLDLLNDLDAGKTANNGDPQALIFVGSFHLNPRLDSPPGSILGQRQKQWWKDVMLRSEARWKIWGNSVPLMRFLVNLSALNNGLPDIILSSDSWDGYATERNELMAYLISNNVNNVISLSGDFHAHFAGSVMNNYDAQDTESIRPAVTEFVCGSISSVSMFTALRQRAQRENPTEIEQLLQNLISYDASTTTEGGENRTVNNLNNTLVNGVKSGVAAAQTNLPSEIEAEKEFKVNSHLKYADTDGHGFGLVQITENEARVQLITIQGINSDTESTSPGTKRITSFSLPSVTGPGMVALSDPVIEGERPFPL